MPEARQRNTFGTFMRRVVLPALPLLLVFVVYTFPASLEITEIKLSIPRYLSFAGMLLVSMVWQALPFRRFCHGSGLYHALYDLIPFEAYCLLLFAQWHFVAAAVLLAVLLVLILAWEILMLVAGHKDRMLIEENEEIGVAEQVMQWEQTRREYRNMRMRIPLLFAFLLMAGPCFMDIVLYDMGSPTYTPLAENAPAVYVPTEDPDTILEDNAVLLAGFNEGSWSQYTFEEKLAMLQQLHNLECARLGVPSVPVVSKPLDGGTLAVFNSDTVDIAVSTKYLNTATAQDIMFTMCHETYHRHQCYLMDNLEKDNPLMNTEYFRQLRDWFENSDNYVDGTMDYDSYVAQPLEASANAWAEAEMAQISVWIPQS